ncbi:MAG: dTMP kinase [Candidatus Diapherotrites archaeon]
MKGVWIVIEGIDGSGKGTLAHEIKEWALKNGIPQKKIVLTAEPTKSNYGKKIRKILANQTKTNTNELYELYIKDRKEHLKNKIIPSLEKGKLIICDRFKYSTLVYQSLQGIDFEKIIAIHKDMPLPNIVFILDLPVEIALSRIKKRTKKEFFETKNFLEKAREKFLELKTLLPKENIHVIDASKEKNDVKEKVIKKLEQTDLLKRIATAGD